MAETLSLKIGPKRYRKVTKPMARKLYEEGKSILMCACKLNPASEWGTYSIISNKDEVSFDRAVNAFTYYNCNSETGSYPHYYVKEE